MKTYLLLFPTIVVLLSGCEKGDDFPKAASSGSGSTPITTKATNNNISFTATDWFFGVGNVGSLGNPNNYRSTLVTSTSNPISTSGLGGVVTKGASYSLSITAATIVDTASLSYWTCPVASTTPLKVGSTLTLSAKVRLENVQGNGVSLVLRGDKGARTGYLFATTQGKTTIKGNADFVEYSVTLPYSSPVDLILIYLTMLPKTTGTVIFSDVSVQVN